MTSILRDFKKLKSSKDYLGLDPILPMEEWIPEDVPKDQRILRMNGVQT